MTDESKKEESKPEDIKVPTYKDKIESLLSKVSKGESVYSQTLPPEENTTYKKMKEMGGIEKGLIELFKIQESSFDVPHYVTEESDEQVEGTKLFKVHPPSNHPDADDYWKRVSPHLKRMGKEVAHNHHKDGELELEVTNKDGQPEVLKAFLVRDEENNERPTIAFHYADRDDLTPEEIVDLVQKVGLKADRFSAIKSKGNIIMDVVEK